MKRTIVIGSVSLAVALASALASPQDASAQRLRARVYLVQHKIPGSLSERGLLRFARGHNRRRLMETNEERPRDRSWKAKLVVSFNKPPGDLEFHVKFYDIHDGPRKFLEDMAVYTGDRSQKTVVSDIHLERPDFKPNRRMELVVTVSRTEVGRRRFETRGERKRRSGQVGFAPSETAGGGGQQQGEEEDEEQEEEEDDGIPRDPLAVDDEPVDTSDQPEAEDMALPTAPGQSAPPETQPSAAGKKGGLCSAATGDPRAPLEAAELAALGLLLAARRRRSK